MNIIWFTKITDKDTFGNTQLMISDALRKQGNIVTLILARHFTEKKEDQEGTLYLPTIDIRFLSGLIYGFVLSLSLPSLLKQRKADIIIVSGDTIWSPFLLFFKLFRIPVIVDLRSLPVDTETVFLKDISLYLSRYVTDGLTTISPELVNILKTKYHLADKKIGIWSSGFSKNQFPSMQEQLEKDSQKDMLLLLHHGTYSPTRGIEELIQSLAKVDEPIKKKLKLTLVGIPQNKIGELTTLATSLHLQEQIEIIPPVDIKKILTFIQACDIGVIPLPPENEWWRVSVPLKTIEYLAMGKPIIATKIPFHQQIFELATCGVLLETNAPQEIARGITYLYHNKEKLHEMGNRGRELVQTCYSWERQASNLAAFLQTFQGSV
jgi:glycosyltransferase involved in cell wall biosynthesis